MRLLTSKTCEEYDDTRVDDRQWRHVLKLEFFPRLSIWLSVDREVKMNPKSDWIGAASYLSMGFNPFNWMFGFGMVFYEQEFWRLSFGPFHINWTL